MHSPDACLVPPRKQGYGAHLGSMCCRHATLTAMHRFSASPRLPWRQNTLRFLPIDAQAPGLLGHICRSISSRTHKHAGKRRAAIMNKTSADATRLTAPPALHWARDRRALHPRRHGPTRTFEGFFFLVGSAGWISFFSFCKAFESSDAVVARDF